MELPIVTFLLSLLISLTLIRTQNIHKKLSHDNNFLSPQKFHTEPVPRIGGLGIFLSILISTGGGYLFLQSSNSLLLLQLLICALPSFGIGFLEDITKKIGIQNRLMGTALSAILSGFFLNIWITHTQVIGIDSVLSIGLISQIFTIFAVTGLANAYNIIDGFNGLASMVGTITLLAIGYVALKVNDPILAINCLIISGAILGFFIWNYPKGLIFLGDGGAYLIGFLISSLSILLVIRNHNVSPWFALLINGYPIFETLFTIWRRKIHQNKNPTLPDGAHFHSLIYRRIIRWAKITNHPNTSNSFLQNARTSPYLWLLSSMATFPAIIWWHNTTALQFAALLFCIFYVWCYRSIVQFKTPKIFNSIK